MRSAWSQPHELFIGGSIRIYIRKICTQWQARMVLNFAPMPLTSFRVQSRGNPVWTDLITCVRTNAVGAVDILLYCNYTLQKGYGSFKDNLSLPQCKPANAQFVRINIMCIMRQILHVLGPHWSITSKCTVAQNNSLNSTVLIYVRCTFYYFVNQPTKEHLQ